jgi:hypothetical protein
MNDDIIRMAREVGIEWDLIDDDEGQIWYIHPGTLELFAALVRAAEQDRCCRIIFGMAGSDNVAQRTVDAIRGKE